MDGNIVTDAIEFISRWLANRHNLLPEIDIFDCLSEKEQLYYVPFAKRLVKNSHINLIIKLLYDIDLKENRVKKLKSSNDLFNFNSNNKAYQLAEKYHDEAKDMPGKIRYIVDKAIPLDTKVSFMKDSHNLEILLENGNWTYGYYYQSTGFSTYAYGHKYHKMLGWRYAHK